MRRLAAAAVGDDQVAIEAFRARRELRQRCWRARSIADWMKSTKPLPLVP
jgi:hypothetical protein